MERVTKGKNSAKKERTDRIESQSSGQRQGNAMDLRLKLNDFMNKRFKSRGRMSSNSQVAFKNATSFALWVNTVGLRVIEKSAQIHFEHVSEDTNLLRQIIYIDHLDCYLLSYKGKIYRKDIDNNPLYAYIDVNSCNRLAASFKYSKVNERLIIVKDKGKIGVVNLDKKQVEIEVRSEQITNIQDLELVGPPENKIALIDRNGVIGLCTVNYELKKLCKKNYHQIELIEDRKEGGVAIASSHNGEYLLVSLINSTIYDSSRIILYKIKDHSLVKLGDLDEDRKYLQVKWGLKFFLQAERDLILFGLSGSNRHIQLYSFNTGKKKLKELVKKRLKHFLFGVLEIHQVGSKFYFTGLGGQIKELSFSYS